MFPVDLAPGEPPTPFSDFPSSGEGRQADGQTWWECIAGWVGGSGVWEKLLSLSLASAKLIYNLQTCGLLAPTQLCGFTLGSPAEEETIFAEKGRLGKPPSMGVPLSLLGTLENPEGGGSPI